MRNRSILSAAGPSTSAGTVRRPFFGLLDDEECWRRMPPALSGGGGRLPVWVGALAAYVPRTAAAMLELDLAQRTAGPLDPLLRAKMRWVVAEANRSSYGMACAAFDFERGGGSEADFRRDDRNDHDRDAFSFARLLTIDAPSITDNEFAALVKRYGEKRVAAMVLLAAYGNFQDRLVWGFNLSLEADGPLAPVEVKFAPGAFALATSPQPPSRAGALGVRNRHGVLANDPEWSDFDYEQLQARLERQRSRPPRLRVPSWDEVKAKLPSEYPASHPLRIVWSLVCLGYVPELAVPWAYTTRTFWHESRQDRVFEESLFWVQTRAVRCNYCMGHCEMLLEVAGLDRDAVRERTRHLASRDWSAFPAWEQRAYAFARKLTKAPWEITPSDADSLRDDLCEARALYTIWWLCRGLYMTRVSDGFQLPLESENVFASLFPKSN